MGVKNADLEELFDFWFSNDVCRLWGRLFRCASSDKHCLRILHNHAISDAGSITCVQLDVIPSVMTDGTWCRCQYDGPFVLDPEEVESGSFMSLQVLRQRHALLTAPASEPSCTAYKTCRAWRIGSNSKCIILPAAFVHTQQSN